MREGSQGHVYIFDCQNTFTDVERNVFLLKWCDRILHNDSNVTYDYTNCNK